MITRLTFAGVCIALAMASRDACAAEVDEPARMIAVWPGLAPGETTKSSGEALPRRENEKPPATRIGGITQPMLEVFEPVPSKKNGVAVIICPGGAYNYVVRDKEGSEAARWLNELGVTAYVLRYRTKVKELNPVWLRPLQDAQRAISLIRASSGEWKLDEKRIGILGFSAGGQVAALALTRDQERAYAAIDKVDETSCRADFGMLIYPWQLVNAKGDALIDEIKVTAKTPPTFLVHAHDDNSTSLSSVLFYAEMKRQKVAGELHIYQNGGHGFGLRPVKDSIVHTWPQRGADWLRTSGIVPAEASK